MKYRGMKNKKGQTVVELAIFGGIILFVFGMLLSYLQRMNNQQYVQMEVFRRALQKACTYQGPDVDGAGASVQLTMIANLRDVDLYDNFRKGSQESTRASASVFWAVPKVGSQPKNLIIYRVNEDESPDLAAGGDKTEVDDIQTRTNTTFTETIQKNETPQEITNIRTSRLGDTIITTLVDKDGNPIKVGDKEQTFTQRLYLDKTGEGQYQYKYSTKVAQGYQVERSKTWTTEFTK